MAYEHDYSTRGFNYEPEERKETKPMTTRIKPGETQAGITNHSSADVLIAPNRVSYGLALSRGYSPQKARLIAAAPDLLAALQDIASGNHWIGKQQQIAKAAIAKAEGR